MSLQFPHHVVETLRQHGFVGDPVHWTFSAKELSSQRAYISFPLNIGFCVTNNTWEHVCMAKACLLPSDYTALRARKIELQHIKGIEKTVWLFSDGSMQWLEKGKRTCTSITNGSTQKTLAQWDVALAKKENSWFSRWFGQKHLASTMRMSLASWLTQLSKIEATRLAMKSSHGGSHAA